MREELGCGEGREAFSLAAVSCMRYEILWQELGDSAGSGHHTSFLHLDELQQGLTSYSGAVKVNL